MSKMGSHDPFGHPKHKLWPKERSEVKLAIWFPTTKSQELNLISLCASGMRHALGKLSTRATTFLYTSSQSKVYAKSYGAPKSQESKLWEFRDSHLRVSGQNAIWMWASWRGTKYIIKGKVVASPKFGPWWILWVWICSCLVHAPKVFKLCTNQLVVWFV